jgi:Cd2+/Zn2+-exporting ATPase
MSESQTRLHAVGMDCASCATKIANAVRRVTDFDDVSVSVTAGSMTVLHAGTLGLDAAVLRQVNGLGSYYRQMLAWMRSFGEPARQARRS